MHDDQELPEGITFTNTTPIDALPINSRLVRTPTSKKLQVTILSHEPWGTYVHYHAGRTVPHNEHHCAACTDGMRMEFKSWVYAMNRETGEQIILELPAAACNGAVKLTRERGTLRGTRLLLYRIPAKANGRVRGDWADEITPDHQLPKVPSVIPALIRMWGLKNNLQTYADGAPTEAEARRKREEQ